MPNEYKLMGEKQGWPDASFKLKKTFYRGKKQEIIFYKLSPGQSRRNVVRISLFYSEWNRMKYKTFFASLFQHLSTPYIVHLTPVRCSLIDNTFHCTLWHTNETIQMTELWIFDEIINPIWPSMFITAIIVWPYVMSE